MRRFKTYDIKNDIKYNNSSMIGAITIGLNKANFDNYKRSYKKLQALIAELMSILSYYI